MASEFTMDGPVCAHLEREYASNDEQAFLDAFLRIGRERGAQYVLFHPPLVFNDELPGYSPNAQVSTVDGTSAALDIYDVDDADYHAPMWLDTRAWRFVIRLSIWDSYDTQGGGCHL